MSSGAADRVARWAADRETPNGGVTVTTHTGADFEAGRVHHRNEQIAGAQPSDRRNPDEVRQEQASLRSSSTTQRGIQGFLSDGGGATTVVACTIAPQNPAPHSTSRAGVPQGAPSA